MKSEFENMHNNTLKKKYKAVSEKKPVVSAEQKHYPKSVTLIRWVGDNWRTIRTTIFKDVELGCVTVNPDTDELSILFKDGKNLCVPLGNYIVDSDGKFSHVRPDNLMSLSRRK